MTSQEFTPTPPHPHPPHEFNYDSIVNIIFKNARHTYSTKALSFFFLKRKKYTDLYTKPKGVKDGHIFLDRWNDSWIRKVHVPRDGIKPCNPSTHTQIHKKWQKKQQNLHCIKLKYFWFAHRAMLMFVKILYPCIKLFLQGFFFA